MKRAVMCCLVPCLLAVLASSGMGKEWTRFRGPNGAGNSPAKNLPATWTEEDYNWRIKLPGVGHSSPVLWENKLFILSADDSAATRFVVCVDAHNGKTLWAKSFPFTVHHKHTLNSFASSTPAVDAQRVYISATTPDEYTLMALDHQGEVVWKRDLGPFVSQHSGGISPIVYEDLVILGNDQDAESRDKTAKGVSFLIAVDARTGETRWQVPRTSDLVAYSTPCIYRPSDGKDELIFNSKAHGITSLDPETGRVNWEIANLFDKRSVSSPILAGGLIFGSCGAGGGGNYVVAIEPGSQQNNRLPKLAWKIDKSAPYVPTPVALGDLVFLWSDQGVLTCADAASGEVHWRNRVGGNYYGSPIIADGKLYCINTDGEVVVVAAKREGYELLGRVPLGEYSHSTPAVDNGVLYLRTASQLFSLGGKAAE